MDKLTYLAELAEGLARWVPARERQDILRYYAEYFEEAGPDREAQVIQELGDPWALSCRLAVEGGYVTAGQAAAWTPKKRKAGAWAAAAVLLVIAVAASALRFGWSIIRTVSGFVVTKGTTTVFAEAVPDTPVYFGSSSASEDWGFYTEDFYSTFAGSLEVFDAISADISLGNITVAVGDDYTLWIDRGENLGDYSLKWEVKDGTLKLRDGGAVKQDAAWDDIKNLFGTGRYRVDVTITVPDNGVVMDKVSVKTGLGNVSLYDVPAEKVTAETGMGNVECCNSRQAKKLELETGLGNVLLVLDEPLSGADIDLESGMGNVEANLGGRERDCAYELKSGMGSVTVNGGSQGSKAARKGSTSYKLDAESGMGDVHVWFYGD